MNDENPIEEPFVRAVIGPGTQPDTEAVDVLIVWDDLAEIIETALALLPQLAARLADEDSFSGEIRFILPPEFLDDAVVPSDLAAHERRLAAAAHGLQTKSGHTIRPTLRIGVTP